MKHIFIFIIVTFFLTACGSSEHRCSETRELSINPSKGIGPYHLGMTEEELVDILCPEYTKKEEKAWECGCLFQQFVNIV